LDTKVDAAGRRAFTPQWKMDIVQQATSSSRSVSLIARENNINTNQVFRWIREAKQGQARWVRIATGALPVEQSNVPATFLPVAVAPPKPALPTTSSITVELANGHRMTVNHADAQMVRVLLSALS
jgi:transposase